MPQRKYLRFVSTLTLSAMAVWAADGIKVNGADRAATAGTPPARATLPPVLRNNEPADNVFVMLPGAPTAGPSTPVKAFVPPPAATAVPVEVAERTEPAPLELVDPGRPVLRRAPRPIYPVDFEKDSGMFCQKQIGQWKEQDALTVLGAASSDRPAYDDQQVVNGRIYAFSDPTNRYRQLELDFDSDTGALRTVFVYPWKMTWLDCRRMWDGNVSATDAPNGRKFFSFSNRRVDVLVDAGGKVISIGLY